MEVTYIAYRFHKESIDNEIDKCSVGYIYDEIQKFQINGEIDKVMAFCRRMISKYPDKYFSYQKLGYIYENYFRRPDIAERFYKDAIKFGAGSSIHITLAKMFKKNNDIENAEKHYLCAIKIFEAVDYYKDLAELYHENGDLEKAERFYKKVISKTEFPSDKHTLALLYLETEDYKKSIPILKEIKDESLENIKRVLTPHNQMLFTRVCDNLSYAYKKNGDPLLSRFEEKDFQRVSSAYFSG